MTEITCLRDARRLVELLELASSERTGSHDAAETAAEMMRTSTPLGADPAEAPLAALVVDLAELPGTARRKQAKRALELARVELGNLERREYRPRGAAFFGPSVSSGVDNLPSDRRGAGAA